MKSSRRFATCCLFAGVALTALAQAPVDHSTADHTKMHEGAQPGVASGGHMERHFDDAEQWAKEFDDPTRDAWQMPDKILAALNLKPGQAVADIGAGTGYFTIRLAKISAALKVYAVDIEASMVDHLRKRAAAEGLKNVVPIQASLESANLPEPVDLILVVDTYHHIADRGAYFRRLAASLKPQGRLVIVDWKKGGPMGPPDEFRFEPAQLTAELAASGFGLATKHDFLPNQLFLIYTKSKKK